MNGETFRLKMKICFYPTFFQKQSLKPDKIKEKKKKLEIEMKKFSQKNSVFNLGS